MTNTAFFPYILGSEFVNIVVDGKPHTIQSSNPVFPTILQCIKNRDMQGVRDNISISNHINSHGGGVVTVKDGNVYYGDEIVHNEISLRILKMLSEGFDVQPMVNFLQNLMMNPSQSAIQELYLFLEANELPITDDGHFLAYKVVRSDFTDKHTGTFDNSVGSTPKMDRALCDTNRDNVCSTGLHFCGLDYLQAFGYHGDKVVIVKINPKDVTSIPSDYNNAKGRACEYLVYEFYGNFEDVFKTQRWEKSVEVTQSQSTTPDVSVESVITNPIKTARTLCGYSQKSVAEYAGYSKSTLWNAEQEDNHPKPDTIQRWIDAMNSMLDQDKKGFRVAYDPSTGKVWVK